MKRYRVVHGFMKPRGGAALPGEILTEPGDLDEKTARQLVARGRVAAVEAAPAPPPSAAPAEGEPASSGPAPEDQGTRRRAK